MLVRVEMLGWIRGAGILVGPTLATAAVSIGLMLHGFPAASWAQGEPADSAARGPTTGESSNIDDPWQGWWRSTQQELFAGIELSAEQQQAIDAIVAQAAVDRARARELTEEIASANRAGNTDQMSDARAELQQMKPKLGPDWRIDAMGELLSEDQRVVFDRQRRLRSDRLFAEQSRRHQQSQRRQPRKKAGPEPVGPPQQPPDGTASPGPR